VQGERLDAKRARGAAGDWLVVGPGDVATLAIRFVLETKDGALILVDGKGRTDAARPSSAVRPGREP
jgi:hypothetical protein